MSKPLKWLFLSLGFGLALPVLAQAQSVTSVVVKLELFDGDKNSHAFAEALRQAVADDRRFQVSDSLPADGLRVITRDAVAAQNDDSRNLVMYSLDFKLGSGKYMDHTQGVCDLGKMAMCGRVVAEDTYQAYTAYMAKHPPKP